MPGSARTPTGGLTMKPSSLKGLPLELRFWLRVDFGPYCWTWTGGRMGARKAYGCITVQRAPRAAHRWSYEFCVGPIPRGLQLDHLCRNTLCVNPDHLEPVTQQENNRRSTSPSAQRARQVACFRGHPFDDANTYWWRGHRQCRTCNQLREKTNRLDPAVRNEAIALLEGAHGRPSWRTCQQAPCLPIRRLLEGQE
jgi:hypothetical protein